MLLKTCYSSNRWGHAVEAGEVPDTLAGRTIGPLIHSRWLTRAIRTVAKYTRTKKPTKKFQRIVFFILNFYLPGWFKIKSLPHCQQGARHLQYLLELSRDLPVEDQVIVKQVMGNNAHFAHAENVAIACLSDPSEEVRRKGVNFIIQSREAFNKEEEVRKFIPPEVNMKSEKFSDLVNLETSDKTEPPLTKDQSDETIKSTIAAPLHLPPYPNNTQSVERMVRVVCEAASKRAGYEGRHRLILQTLESRKRVKIFDTKKQDAVFD